MVFGVVEGADWDVKYLASKVLSNRHIIITLRLYVEEGSPNPRRRILTTLSLFLPRCQGPLHPLHRILDPSFPKHKGLPFFLSEFLPPVMSFLIDRVVNHDLRVVTGLLCRAVQKLQSSELSDAYLVRPFDVEASHISGAVIVH